MSAKKVYVGLDMRGNPINSVLDPAAAQDAATKHYVDTRRVGNVTAVPYQAKKSRRWLMKDGTWRDPLLLGTGTVAVGAITTIQDDTKYNAWPVVCRLEDRRLLLAYTKADGHHTSNVGRCVARFGAENNVGAITWGAEFDIYLNASRWSSPYGITQISTGRIIAVLWRDNQSSSPSGEAGFVYSDDAGATWSAWQALASSFTQEAFGAGPVVELSNGDLLLTIEGTASGTAANRSSHTLRSTDHGLTWGSEVTVRNYVTDTRPYYESKLVLLPNDTLLCIHRTSGGTGTHYISTSTDGGLTWSAPVSAFDGYGAPSTIVTSTGTLITATRRNSDAALIVYTSADLGATWSAAVALDATMNEMEYGCPIELLDGRVLVVYGYQPTSSVTNADVKQVYLTETVVNLAAGVSPLTTKGDLYGFDVAGNRLPVGADGTYPRADSAAALGITWSTLHVEPHVAYDGTVVLDGNGDPVMVLLA